MRRPWSAPRFARSWPQIRSSLGVDTVVFGSRYEWTSSHVRSHLPPRALKVIGLELWTKVLSALHCSSANCRWTRRASTRHSRSIATWSFRSSTPKRRQGLLQVSIRKCQPENHSSSGLRVMCRRKMMPTSFSTQHIYITDYQWLFILIGTTSVLTNTQNVGTNANRCIS